MDRDEAWDDALRRGMYHAQLSNVLASFPRDQLLVLQFERCVAAPQRMLEDTFEFLGLDPFSPKSLHDTVNRGSAPSDNGRTEELRDAYASDLAALLRDHPQIDPSLWPTVSAS